MEASGRPHIMLYHERIGHRRCCFPLHTESTFGTLHLYQAAWNDRTRGAWVAIASLPTWKGERAVLGWV